MGTAWSPYDIKAREKYRKGKANAEILAVRKLAAAEKTAEIVVGDSTAIEL